MNTSKLYKVSCMDKCSVVLFVQKLINVKGFYLLLYLIGHRTHAGVTLKTFT